MMFVKKSAILFILLSVHNNECTEEFKITDQIYFDIQVDDAYLGRIVFGLFGEVVPKTVRNFKEIALKGIDGKSYLGTRFHTAIERIFIQGGDILYDNGTGSISIYGKYFDDENFTIKPDSAGLLVMVNHGPNTNGCQFLITTMAVPWIEDTNVVFGKVLKGEEVVHRIEHYKTDVNDKILRNVVVTGVGEIVGAPFYEPSKNYELTFWAWIKAGWFPLLWSFAILAFFQMIIKRLDRYIEIKEGRTLIRKEKKL
ncbi:unnamed protein product [Callosobruchus maculatus]|uniref:Peptidyl-prolyl cis-trans isomerase n=1 Tax=Callosobruchus maculatus TaxID=64391 RepID=A0A653BT78_CALMS|nr:unnamed protein product [Callosobruchus maculatus]